MCVPDRDPTFWVKLETSDLIPPCTLLAKHENFASNKRKGNPFPYPQPGDPRAEAWRGPLRAGERPELVPRVGDPGKAPVHRNGDPEARSATPPSLELPLTCAEGGLQ